MSATSTMAPIDVSKFPVKARAINVLKENGIQNSESFRDITIQDLKKMKGLGAGSVKEILLFLAGIGVKFKAIPKVKKPPRWHPETKAILISILGDRINNFGREMERLGKMIEHYGVETMKNFKMHDGIDSLCYYFSNNKISPWVDTYVLKFAPTKLSKGSEEKKPVPVPQAPIEPTAAQIEHFTNKQKEQPKSLSDFMGLRNK